MTGEANAHQNPETLTEEQAERMLSAMNEVIRAGEEMRKLRAEMVNVFVGFGWTQDRIARLTDMSQPAVSKQVTKYRAAAACEPRPETGLALDQRDAPWLEGRLWGLAEEIAENCDTARCARYVNAIARGKKRFTPQNVDELRRLVEADLKFHQAELPGSYRDAYDVISRGLDLPSKAASPASPASPASAGSPSVRRALACEVQRDQLRATRTG